MPKSLLSSGVVMLYGDVGDLGWGDGFTPEDVNASLVEHGPSDVVVRLNSGGGSAFDGMAIYSLLKAHNGRVTMQIDGIAASAASLIAMAGDDIEMRDGAMMMIHDAAGFTFGPSADHEKSAAVLDKLSAQYASVYARRTGKPAEAMRALMIAETWLSAEDAIAQGLATGTIEDKAETAAAFDYRVYAKAPASILAAARPFPEKPAAKAAPQKEIPHMPTPAEIAAKAAADAETARLAALATAPVIARAAEANAPTKPWALAFYALAGTKGMTLAETNTIVASVDNEGAAKDALIDALAAKQAGTVPNGLAGHITVTADARDKFVAGVSQAMLAQGKIVARDGANEFNGVKPMDVVREVLARNGVKGSRDPMRMVASAITHSSGDFSQITSNVAEKSMLKGYEETEETFTIWTSTGSLSDFKQARKIDLNAMPALPQLTESASYKYLTTGDRGELYSLGTAGGLFSITRQAIINDDMDVFMKVPMRLGRAAKRTIGNDVYGLLVANPIMSDGLPLFHATHGNLMPAGASSAFSATSLQAADIAMGVQKDRSKNAVALNIVPKYLLGARAQKFNMLQTLRSSAAIGQGNAGVINPVQNLVETIINEARLDAASATGWYLAADQNATDTVQVSYLNGNEQPFLDVDRPFEVDGATWKVRIDYGVKAFAWEGLYKSPGA